MNTFCAKLVDMNSIDSMITMPAENNRVYLRMDFETRKMLLIKLPTGVSLCGVESTGEVPEPLDIMNRDKFFLRIRDLAKPEELRNYMSTAEDLIYREFDYALPIDEFLTTNNTKITLEFKCRQNGEVVYFTVAITE